MKRIQIRYGEDILFPRLMLERPGVVFNLFPKDYCDIISLDIPESFRGQENGSRLYSCVEDLAKSYDCKKIITAPSGCDLDFWLKRGSSDEGRLGWEKRLR